MAIIGIDLGTTNSLVSAWTDHGVQLIPNALGEYLTPSVVSFDQFGQVYVGNIAKERLITDPFNTFCEFKRMMGTEETVRSRCQNREYTPEELSALVIKQLRDDAEKYLGESVTEAIISVPAYFNDLQRSATREAGRLAGLTVERLINEPSAAALAYHMKQDNSAKYIVYDFGGGTLDVSIVDAFENIVEIHAVAGDNHLGGKDFNEVIAQDFLRENKINSDSISKNDYQIVCREAEKVKIELTTKKDVVHSFYLSGQQYEMRMTNQKLIEISANLLTRMILPIKKVLNELNLDYNDITMMILVGGSSKMPIVKQFLKSVFPLKICDDTNVDEIVGIGVGTVAGMKLRKENIKDMILSDICPFSLGVEIADGSMSNIIERNEVLPTSHEETYYTVQDNQTHVKMSIYQGEHFEASKNLLIDILDFTIPPMPAGAVQVQVRFSYDIDGIFDIDINSKIADVKIHKSIINEHSGLSAEELELRRQELDKLKIPPREKAENQMLISMAERLSMECNEEQRDIIRSATKRFLAMLDLKDVRKIRESTVKFSLFLSMIEKQILNINVDTKNFWNENEFEEQVEKEEDGKEKV